MDSRKQLKVKVWGDFACFTRPEMKVERVSYPVITPSAARGVLDAIFWKPEFKWRVRRIDVLKPIVRFSILRNEVNNKMVARTAKGWEKRAGGFFADEDRSQRHTLALKDVAYVIHADIDLLPHADADPAKYRDQFRRRVAKGRCFHQPYFGCREFSAYFEEPGPDDRPEDITGELGMMLFDLAYDEDGSGNARPRFFHARLEKGVMDVPGELYDTINGEGCDAS